jgi:hypothetical protein
MEENIFVSKTHWVTLGVVTHDGRIGSIVDFLRLKAVLQTIKNRPFLKKWFGNP